MSKPPYTISDILKTPFVDGGREVGKGLDCWGNLMATGKLYGMELPDFSISCFDKNMIFFQFLQSIKEQFPEVREPRVGDVVGLNLVYSEPALVQHFGMVVEGNRFIHTTEKLGPHLVKLDDISWKKRIRGFYRWNPSK